MILRDLIARVRSFKNDEEGSITVMTMFLIIAMVFTSGIAVDLMRYEMHRARLQATLDGAVLAAAHLDVCLDPERDPHQMVTDYIDKRGYGSVITNIDVQPGSGECTVDVSADLQINTIFMRLLSVDDIGGISASRANHEINTVEISLVLDVSTSMRNGGRMDAMRPAAAAFVTTLFGPTDDNDVIMSLVPYATQVSLGPDLLSQYNVEHGHDFSWCIDLPDTMFDQVAIPTTQSYLQSAHFDPYTSGSHFRWVPSTNPPPTTTSTATPPPSDNTGYDSVTNPNGPTGTVEEVEEIYELQDLGRTPCDPHPRSFVLPFQTASAPLVDRINTLWPYGDTSINHGARWGTALLDPTSQPVVNGLIADGAISPDAAGSPINHADGGTKIMVLMSDGINTDNWVMDPDLRDQMSNVWLGNMTPSGPTGDHFDADYDPYDSDAGFQQGTADPESNSYYFVQTQEPGDADGDGIPNEDYYVVLMEYMADLDPSDALRPEDVWTNNVNGQRQSYQDLWARWGVKTYAISFLRDPYFATPYLNYWNDFTDLLTRYRHDEKNTQLQATCDAAKAEGIIVYTIGFEISDLGAQILSNCATSPSHFYRAGTANIEATFSNIAASIQALRLTQ